MKVAARPRRQPMNRPDDERRALACKAKVFMVLRGLSQAAAAKAVGLERHELRSLDRWQREEFKPYVDAAVDAALDAQADRERRLLRDEVEALIAFGEAEQTAVNDEFTSALLLRLQARDERRSHVISKWRLRQAVRVAKLRR